MSRTAQTLYPHLVAAVYDHPWAIHDGTMNIILGILAGRVGGIKLSPDEIEARLVEARADHGPREGRRRESNVAVVPIYGVITPRGGMMANSSGGTSVESIRNDFRAALHDPEVDAIAFDVDSPGGAVDGIPELADEIFSARGQKPMTAIANTMAASAALWLAASADRIVASPSAQVGSIGVMAVHQDKSEKYAKDGVKHTLIKSAPFKNEATDTQPLSDEAQAAIQADVDHYDGMFTAHMAQGRGVTPEAVRSSFGQGRMLVADRALTAGLIDGIQGFEGAVYDLAMTADMNNQGLEARTWNSGTSGLFWDTSKNAVLAVDEARVVDLLVQRAVLGTDKPFAERLALVTAELEAVAGIARDRAARRVADGRPLSGTTLEHLSRIKAALDTLVTATPEDPVAAGVASTEALELMLRIYQQEG
jgi:capsid assembly protease